jgi:hypothetical protein
MLMLTTSEHSSFAAAAATRDPCALHRALEAFLSNGSLDRILDGPLQEPSTIAEVGLRSYRHDNGFWKLALAESAAYKLRAHFWFRWNTPAFLPNIHNHRWDFSSVILCGGYRQHLFAASRCGNGLNTIPVRAWTYRPSDGTQHQQVTAMVPTHLSHLSSAEYKARDAVVLRAEQLHRVLPIPDCTTITMVVTGTARRLSTDVYSERELSVLPEHMEKQLSPDDVRWALSELRRAWHA